VRTLAYLRELVDFAFAAPVSASAPCGKAQVIS
jgi:hypothetical protein